MVTKSVAFVVAGSVVVSLQCLVQEKQGWDFYWVWALCTGCASWISLLAAFALGRTGVGGPEKAGTWRVPPLFLALLWTVGAMLTTMVKPFSVTGNGYFGVWAALVASWSLALTEHGSLREPLERMADACGASLSLMAVLLAASITAFLQTSVSCATVAHWCNGNAAWVLVCSAASLALCLVLMLPQVAEAMKPNSRFLALFFLVWWAAGTVVTTFEEPYAYTFANGYFSCWAAVIVSLFLVEASFGLNVSQEVLHRASQVTGGTPTEVIGLLTASLAALVAAAIDCGDKPCGSFEAWAIICCSTSLAICFFVIIYTIRGGWVIQGAALEKVSMFLLAWWALGTTCMTFQSPFHILGNGYLAAWAALISSMLLAAKYVEKVRDRLDDLGLYGRELCFVLFCSAVLLMQAVWDCALGSCTAGRGWGMACGLLSMIACFGIAFFRDKVAAHVKWAVTALFVWWCIAVFSLTFSTTYVHTGNSYFACWGAWAACVRALMQQFPDMKGYADLDFGAGAQPVRSASSETPAVIGAKTEGLDGPACPPPIVSSGDFEIGQLCESPESEGASANDFFVSNHGSRAGFASFPEAGAAPPSFSGSGGESHGEEERAAGGTETSV